MRAGWLMLAAVAACAPRVAATRAARPTATAGATATASAPSPVGVDAAYDRMQCLHLVQTRARTVEAPLRAGKLTADEAAALDDKWRADLAGIQELLDACSSRERSLLAERAGAWSADDARAAAASLDALATVAWALGYASALPPLDRPVDPAPLRQPAAGEPRLRDPAVLASERDAATRALRAAGSDDERARLRERLRALEWLGGAGSDWDALPVEPGYRMNSAPTPMLKAP